MEDRLSLPQVTLCAVTSVNVQATIKALEICLEQIDFAACKLLTDVEVAPCHPAIKVMPIPPLTSLAAYSDFMLTGLVDHVETSHCLVVQWDGHVLDAGRWRDEFLDYDYIGARWPQFNDGHDVGNGGFSLRSRRLMEACRAPAFIGGGAEDLAVGRINRTWLEEQGMHFAPAELADVFSTERAGDLSQSFGYHGVFNMPDAIGVDAFWEIYKGLDDRGTIWHDFRKILISIAKGKNKFDRIRKILYDYISFKRSE